MRGPHRAFTPAPGVVQGGEGRQAECPPLGSPTGTRAGATPCTRKPPRLCPSQGGAPARPAQTSPTPWLLTRHTCQGISPSQLPHPRDPGARPPTPAAGLPRGRRPRDPKPSRQQANRFSLFLPPTPSAKALQGPQDSRPVLWKGPQAPFPQSPPGHLQVGRGGSLPLPPSVRALLTDRAS